MFSTSNKIIMIDDSEKDLHDLSAIFSNKGIGCRTFIYDSFYSEPLKGVRVLFIDINLNGGKSDQERNAILQDALIRYVHEDNGPFVLVLWTNHVEWIANFKEYINRGLNTDIAKRWPYYITHIDKAEFYNPENSLEDKVRQIFDTPIVSMLSDFEETMSSSIDRTISQILSIIPHDTLWGEDEVFTVNAQKIFSTIAIQTVGYNFAKENPDKAIRESMIPVFCNSFLNHENNIWNNNLSLLRDSRNQDEVCFPEGFNEAKLNNIFNIDFRHEGKIEDRGAVCPILDTNDLFQDKFNCKYCDWFNHTFPGLTKNERNESILIGVEFSAACDFSQKKKRTNKYLLGAILPMSTLQKIQESKNKGDYLLILPYKFDIDGSDMFIAFNLNYSFTLPQSLKNKILGLPKFCFKKEMMDMIGNKYANHISRIGITTFR